MSRDSTLEGDLPAGGARVPRRARGQLRVEALLAAAAQVFAAKGFEAATMTEIAAQAASSIGSLYQFFPTKGALAAALIASHVEALWQRFDEVADQAAAMSTAELGRTLALLLVDFRSARPSYARLLEAPGVPETLVGGVRRQLRERLAAVLRRHAPGVDPATLAAMAPVVQQAMKAGLQLHAEFADAERAAALAELQAMLAGYLEARLRS